MYRPSEWIEYYKRWQLERKEAGISVSNPRRNFEAGADAMLEGLKKNALVPHDISKPLDEAMLVFNVPDKQGYIVFIQEEE